MPKARFAAAVTMAVAVSACSNATLSDNGPRKPSLRVADAALSSGAPDLALRVADLTLNDDPRNVPALVAKGDALYALGRKEAAQDAYRSAIALEPTTAAAQLGLGRTLVKSDPAGAETAFLTALRADTTSLAALNNLGVVRDMQGRSTEAQEAYHLALSIAPDSPDVKINLSRSLMLAGHNADAAAILRQVAADQSAAQLYQKELAAALTLTGAHTPEQQVSDSRHSRPAPPVSSDRIQALAVTPPPAAPEEGVARPLTAPRQAVGATPLSPRIGEVAEAAVTMPPLPDMSEKKPGLHQEPVAMHHDADRQPFVQLASLLSEPDAMREWQRLSKRMPDILGGHEPTVTPADVAGKSYWRLRTFGFVNSQDASNLCGRLMDAGWKCWTGRGL